MSTISSVMTSGDLGELTPGSYRVVIGAQLATVLGVGVGDEIVLVLAEAARDARRFRAAREKSSRSPACSTPACTNTIAGSCS